MGRRTKQILSIWAHGWTEPVGSAPTPFFSAVASTAAACCGVDQVSLSHCKDAGPDKSIHLSHLLLMRCCILGVLFPALCGRRGKPPPDTVTPPGCRQPTPACLQCLPMRPATFSTHLTCSEQGQGRECQCLLRFAPKSQRCEQARPE